MMIPSSSCLRMSKGILKVRYFDHQGFENFMIFFVFFDVPKAKLFDVFMRRQTHSTNACYISSLHREIATGGGSRTSTGHYGRTGCATISRSRRDPIRGGVPHGRTNTWD